MSINSTPFLTLKKYTLNSKKNNLETHYSTRSILLLNEVSHSNTSENVYASNKEGDDVVYGFVPPVYEKSEEEFALLKEIFLENFLTN